MPTSTLSPTHIVTLWQPTLSAAKWALMDAGPVCVSEVLPLSTPPDQIPQSHGLGFYAYRARIMGTENDAPVFKLLELLDSSD